MYTECAEALLFDSWFLYLFVLMSLSTFLSRWKAKKIANGCTEDAEQWRGGYGHTCMVVGFTTTYAIHAYHH